MYTISIRNMTLVDSQEICIYSDESVIEAYKIEGANIDFEEGSAGKLTIKLPATNVGYDEFETFATQVIVRKRAVDGSFPVYWLGRLQEVGEDFYKNQTLTFEGALNYTIDTIQEPRHETVDVKAWLTHIIDVHNSIVSQAGEYYKCIVPNINDDINTGSQIDFYAEDETTLDLITNVFEGWECHPTFTYNYDAEHGCYVLVLTVKKNYITTAPLPEITFGTNLTDFSKDIQNEEMATAVIPRGKTYTDEERAIAVAQGIEPAIPAELDQKVSVYSVNNNSRIVFTSNTSDLERYGFICKILDYDEVDSPATLLTLAQRYLQDQVWDKTTFNFSALDMNLFDHNLEEISVGKLVHVQSAPHNLDIYIPCTACTVDLLDPSGTTYTLGYKDDRSISNTSRSTDEKLRETVRKTIERETAKETSVTTQAKQNVLQLLNIYDQQLNNRYKGYVHFKRAEGDDNADHITEIVISDMENYNDPLAKMWRWNYSGLYFIDGGYTTDTLPAGQYTNPDDTLKVGITNDGQIVADNITAGTLNADIIKAGKIWSREDPSNTDPEQANFCIDMDNGIIDAKKGTLYFNKIRQSSGTEGSPDQPTKDFAYFSNQEIGRYTVVAGERKKDWMMILGSTFGVDSSGRAYMSEGTIGATGSLFNVVANNTGFVHCTWVQTSYDETTRRYIGELKWTVDFNTDTARPYILDSSSDNEVRHFRFRLARYNSSDELVFMSKLFSFVFDLGTKPQRYSRESFYSAITIDTILPEGQNEPDIPYYDGQIFPIWYSLNDSATSDYYEQDGHRYVMYGATGNVIKVEGYADTPLITKPQRRTYTNARIDQVGSNAGAVNIGPGYLSNGTFGQNRSFYLGGLNTTGEVAGRTGDDWRFTVGSRLGVTDDGTVYCNGMVANNVTSTGGTFNRANVSGTFSASNINASSVTNLNLTGSYPLDNNYTTYEFLAFFRTSELVASGTAPSCVFSNSTPFYVKYVGATAPTGQTPMAIPANPKLRFYFCRREYIEYQAAPTDVAVGNFTITFDMSNPNQWQHVDVTTQGWNTPTDGWATTGRMILSNVELENSTDRFELSGNDQTKTIYTEPDDPTWQYSSEDYVLIHVYLRYTSSGSTASAVICAKHFIPTSSAESDVSSNCLGEPHGRWNKVYLGNQPDVSSSREVKSDIEGLDLRYDKLFDLMKPVRFHYKDDKSAYHTGFILEDLKESMELADISNSDLAAYHPNDSGVGGGIAYGEFTAINTWQIQKLKRKIDKLEKILYETGIVDNLDD